ncbi:MAG: glutamate--cysteine ligase, partial [Gammaproteobacteria bacterium]|nr:glutamate--cysteine ligase [Gammaproteobacteria bacterium]
SYRQNRLADLSLREFISESYFGLVRNFHKYCWLILYLFGASPAVCKSFLDNNPHGLESFDSHTLHLPFATSLRMSKLGYQNSSQAVVSLCYDSVDEYINCLKQYTETPHPEYEKIGVKRNGEYRQLNANLLQIENEYYSVIRPKRVTLSGEKPSIALADRGVEYVEVRCMDLDPFIPIGIDENQIRFLDIFLLYCLLEESPPIPQPEIKEISENQNLAVTRGREPGIELSNNNKAVKLKGWAGLICQRLEAVAEVLDQAHGSSQYSKVLQGQVEKITHPELTASARILSELETRNISFFRFALEKAEQHERHFKGHLLPKEQRMEYESLAQSSLIQQAEIEHSDKLSFDQFLAEYFAQ